MKKYNSLFTVTFSVNHNEKDGSDITPSVLRDAISKRWDDLYFSGEWDEATDGPFGTEENNATPPAQ